MLWDRLDGLLYDLLENVPEWAIAVVAIALSAILVVFGGE